MKEWSIFLGKCFLYLVIWGSFVAIITNMDESTVRNLPIWVNMIIVLFVFFAPIGISKLIWNKGEEVIKNVSTQITEHKNINETVKSTQDSMTIYADAKNRFKYLSNELLVAKNNQEEKDEMIQLALEEELVELKLISHSPMQEKLDAIMTRFKI